MPTDWNDWDRTSALLDAIESRAKTMKKEAGEVQCFLGELNKRPAFLTECEARLKTLEQDMAVLYAFTKATNEIFHKLPETA